MRSVWVSIHEPGGSIRGRWTARRAPLRYRSTFAQIAVVEQLLKVFFGLEAKNQFVSQRGRKISRIDLDEARAIDTVTAAIDDDRSGHRRAASSMSSRWLEIS